MRRTTEQFVCDAQSIHGDQYDYRLVEYKSVKSKVTIICKKHGVFEMRPGDHLHSRQGCKQCANEAKCLSTAQFIDKAVAVHGTQYDYSLVEYVGNKRPVSIICSVHGPFSQKPNDHLTGTKCPRCAPNAVHTKEQFMDKAIAIHGRTYDYTQVVYRGVKHKVSILCKKHGVFEQTPDGHINQQQGCPHCRVANFSKQALLWLEREAVRTNVTIQHAENLGEFMLPNTRLKVDGYCKETNTVYEFWGDYWHGNPGVYKANEVNKRKRKTFGELYAETMKKRQTILDAGYTLVDIWEKDWYNILKEQQGE